MSLIALSIVVPFTALAFIAGDFGTRLIRQALVAFGVTDLPTERSSHQLPTPRGGGVAIVVAGLGATLVAALAGWLEARLGLALAGGGLLVAVVGWLDDVSELRWRHRLLAQALSAAWALYWLGGFPSLELGFATVALGAFGIPLALLGIIWGINFFNFMDGIDGIAAGQAVFVGTVGGVLLAAAGQWGLAVVALTVAGASAGFLRHNWMPARVFLGDVGSTWLGYTLCVLGVAAANTRAVPMIVWGTLLGAFVFDATLTLARRVRRGHPVHAPHREHAFCRTVRWGWSHARVSMAVMLLNVPLALLGTLAWIWRPAVLPAALAGILLLAAAYRWVEHRFPMDAVAERRLRLEHSAPAPAPALALVRQRQPHQAAAQRLTA